MKFGLLGFIIGCIVDLLFYSWQYNGILQRVREILIFSLTNSVQVKIKILNRGIEANINEIENPELFYEHELRRIMSDAPHLRPLVCSICLTFWLCLPFMSLGAVEGFTVIAFGYFTINKL
jgi:hypothetical protein